MFTAAMLAILTLTGCKAGSETAAPVIQEPETYSITIKDYSAFDATAPLLERLEKELKEDSLSCVKDAGEADWNIRVRLTNSAVPHKQYEGPGHPPLISFGPIEALINAVYLAGWGVKEAGKQAINAGTPNYMVVVRLHVMGPDGKLWKIDDEIALYTDDKEKSREHIARELTNKIDDYLAAFRAGTPSEKAVEETSDYERKQMLEGTGSGLHP